MSLIEITDYILKAGTTIIAGICTGIAVAYFTAKYALKRFYREKWWEKRVAAFLELTGHVYTVKRSTEYWSAYEESKRDQDGSFQKLSEEEENALSVENKQAMREITRISHLATLTLSQGAAEKLEVYLREQAKIYPSWWEDEIDAGEAHEKELGLINTLLTGLLDEARSELNIVQQVKLKASS